MIKGNVEEIKKNIKTAAEMSGRKEEDIMLVAVTKTVPADRIKEAADCDITEIGENYVQELLEKYENLPKDKINIHFIGHLQRNKVKYIVDKVCIIESVDSYELAVEIDKRCSSISKIMDILLEVNIGREESKSGIDENSVQKLFEDISKLKNVSVKGLMCIPPSDCGTEVFDRMRDLCDKLSLPILSMGMSNDYQKAIEHGSTCVRIGTSIFGQRNYNK